MLYDFVDAEHVRHERLQMDFGSNAELLEDVVGRRTLLILLLEQLKVGHGISDSTCVCTQEPAAQIRKHIKDRVLRQAVVVEIDETVERCARAIKQIQDLCQMQRGLHRKTLLL